MLHLLERQIAQMRKNYRSDLTQSISPYLASQHSLPIGVLVISVSDCIGSHIRADQGTFEVF